MLNSIEEAVYTPRFRKYKVSKEETLFMGVELELEFNGSDKEYEYGVISETLGRKRNNIWYCKEDGSLYDGIEFVTHPFSLNYFRNTTKVQELFPLLTNFSKDRSCGLHVHLSKTFYSDEDIEKLRLFFHVNKTNLIKFSKRGCENTFCRFEKFSVQEFLRGETKKDTGRYLAFNYNSHLRSTVEIRMFASTTNVKRLESVLEFCDALSRFIKTVDLNIVKYNNAWDKFLNYCKDNKYKVFLKDWEKIYENMAN